MDEKSWEKAEFRARELDWWHVSGTSLVARRLKNGGRALFKLSEQPKLAEYFRVPLAP